MDRFMELFEVARELHKALRDEYIPRDSAYRMACERYSGDYALFKKFEDAILAIGNLLPYSQEDLEHGCPEDGRLETIEARRRRLQLGDDQ